MVSLALTVKTIGLNSVEECEPSQYGCFKLKPHEHHAYFLPFSTSTEYGFSCGDFFY